VWSSLDIEYAIHNEPETNYFNNNIIILINRNLPRLDEEWVFVGDETKHLVFLT